MIDWKPPTVLGKILGYQLLLIALLSVGIAVFGGAQKALYSAMGGLAAFIPNFYFALRINKSAGQAPRKIVNAFYVGESGKLILTAALFVLIFQVPKIEILPLFAGYVVALSVFWFALLIG